MIAFFRMRWTSFQFMMHQNLFFKLRSCFYPIKNMNTFLLVLPIIIYYVLGRNVLLVEIPYLPLQPNETWSFVKILLFIAPQTFPLDFQNKWSHCILSFKCHVYYIPSFQILVITTLQTVLQLFLNICFSNSNLK